MRLNTFALRQAVRQTVGNGLGDQRLPTPRWAIQEHPFGWAQAMFAEFFGIEIWQLDTVTESLDLAVQTANVGVGHIRHFFQNDLLHLGFWELLQHVVRTRFK